MPLVPVYPAVAVQMRQNVLDTVAFHVWIMPRPYRGSMPKLFVTLLPASSRPDESVSGSAIVPAFVSVSENGGCATIRCAIEEYDVVL